VLHEWRAAVFVWAALPPGSPRERTVCRHLLELQVRLGSEASLLAQEDSRRADLADLHAEAWGATQVLDRLIDKLACLVHETRTEPSAGPSG
jgi:hypothetical protein